MLKSLLHFKTSLIIVSYFRSLTIIIRITISIPVKYISSSFTYSDLASNVIPTSPQAATSLVSLSFIVPQCFDLFDFVKIIHYDHLI